MAYLYRASGRLGPLRATAAARPIEQRMALIRKLAADPTVDESKVHMRTMFVANDLPTSINTQFTRDGLLKVCELAPGNPVMANHSTWRSDDLPRARIFDASLETVADVNWAAFDFSWPKTPNGDEQAAMIDTGTWSESSLGWMVSGAKCSVCARDLFGPDCPHIAGDQYDDQKCLAIMGAEVILGVDEASFVWKGAAAGTFMVNRDAASTREDQPMLVETALQMKAAKVRGEVESPPHPLQMFVSRPPVLDGFSRWFAGT